jgi:hypothetical protein
MRYFFPRDELNIIYFYSKLYGGQTFDEYKQGIFKIISILN